jgi:exonuclease III
MSQSDTLMQRAPAQGLRIVVWNIQQGGGNRSKAIWEQLAALQPDICVLVEYCYMEPSRWLRNRLHEAGLTHHIETVDYTNRPFDGGLLVASRWSLETQDCPLDGALERRWRLVRVEHPEPLVLGVAYVPTRSERPGNKYRYLRSLVSLAHEWPYEPGLIVGDFNSGQQDSDEEVPYFNEREAAFMGDMSAQGWADGFRWMHPDQQPYSWWRRVEGEFQGFRVDHAFVHPALLPRLQRTDLLRDDDTWPSDHAVLVIDLANDRTAA